MDSIKEVGNCLSHEIDPDNSNKPKDFGPEVDGEISRTLENTTIYNDTGPHTRAYDANDEMNQGSRESTLSAEFRAISDTDLEATIKTPNKEPENEEKPPKAPLKRQNAVLDFRQMMPEESFHTPCGDRAEFEDSSLVFERSVDRSNKHPQMPFPGGLKGYQKGMQQFWEPRPENVSTPIMERKEVDCDVCDCGISSRINKKNDD